MKIIKFFSRETSRHKITLFALTEKKNFAKKSPEMLNKN